MITITIKGESLLWEVYFTTWTRAQEFLERVANNYEFWQAAPLTITINKENE